MKKNVALPPILSSQFLIESANRPQDGRSKSEDNVLVDSDRGLLGIFDSVGGRDQGRLISHLAAETVLAFWRSLSAMEQGACLPHIESLLQMAIRQADTAIASLIIPTEQKRPATTVALGILSAQQAQVSLSFAHIGDSRIYLLRAGHSLQRLTTDNGYFPFAVRRGLLTEEESVYIEQAEQISDLTPEAQEHFSKRHLITCAVGWTDFPSIPTHSIPLHPGDCLLFCTDGVHDNLTDQEIEAILRCVEQPGAERLVQAAYQRSHQRHLRAKQDDMSAIVVRYLPIEMREELCPRGRMRQKGNFLSYTKKMLE